MIAANQSVWSTAVTRYSISDLSRDFDITPRTLRFYEEKGLLTPARMGQARVYSAADKVRLALILRGKRLGFTLEESCDIIQMYQPDSDNIEQLEKVIDTVRRKKDQLKQQQRDIKSMLKELDVSENSYLIALQELVNQAPGAIKLRKESK
jgi:DNA-binding transcriptional MerR regulator